MVEKEVIRFVGIILMEKEIYSIHDSILLQLLCFSDEMDEKIW